MKNLALDIENLLYQSDKYTSRLRHYISHHRDLEKVLFGLTANTLLLKYLKSPKFEASCRQGHGVKCSFSAL